MKLWKIATTLALLTTMAGSLSFAGTLEAYSNSGVRDVGGSSYLSGNTSSGDLIQIISVGSNGTIDPPDTLGSTTSDDSLLGTTHVGFGFPFNPNEGKFSKTFTHDLLTAGAVVYVRAWNDSVVDATKYYGDSNTYELQSEMDSHDFGTWTVSNPVHVPVELSSFSVEAKPGYNEIRWTTQSETENLGFHVYRSFEPEGERIQITKKMVDGAINSQVRHDYSYEDRTVDENATYYYWLADIAVDGRIAVHGPQKVISVSRPTAYGLDQNYPNPFNPSTSLTYTLKEDGSVKLRIYNIRGQLIRELIDVKQPAGQHVVEWDGLDNFGNLVPSGTYLYVLDVNGHKFTRKMAMTK